MNISEAERLGIKRLRLPDWANPRDYILITADDSGIVGPWVYLFSDHNKYMGKENPQNILHLSVAEMDSFIAYDGPISADEL